MDRNGLKLGILAGLVGISCCVTPTVLALFGLASVSFAISVGNTLYYTYGWYFRGAALLLAVVGVVVQLRSRKACTLRGARDQWRLLLTVAIVMVAVYLSLYWVTAWLARAATATSSEAAAHISALSPPNDMIARAERVGHGQRARVRFVTLWL